VPCHATFGLVADRSGDPVGVGAAVAVLAVVFGGVSTGVVTDTEVVGLVDSGIVVVLVDVVLVDVVLVDVVLVDVVLVDVVLVDVELVDVVVVVGAGFARGGDCCAHPVVRTTAVRTAAGRETLYQMGR
jgi:hypothetical protein